MLKVAGEAGEAGEARLARLVTSNIGVHRHTYLGLLWAY